MSPTVFFGLTSLGVFHTLVSLVALGTGAIALIRDGKISWDNTLGKIYVVTTVIVCLTGFGIFQHGGFGKPHALGVITLVVLGVVWAASKKSFGKPRIINPGVTAFNVSKNDGTSNLYIERVGYSLTFFFHIVPTITESATRLPYGAPLASSPEDPRVQMASGICFILFLIGAVLQVRKLRSEAHDS